MYNYNMQIRINDKNGDWTFGTSQLSLYRDNGLAVSQAVKTRLLEWTNDCFFNQTAGIDYRVRLGNKNQIKQLDADIRKIITETEGVVALTSYDSYLEDRKLTVIFTVYHLYSTQPYSDIIIVGA